MAITAAQKLKVRPPKVMKVLQGSHINAAVDGSTLYVTEGLRACLWTRTAEGIMAHEMAHLSCKHIFKAKVMRILTGCAILVAVAFIGDPTWQMLLAVALTIVPVTGPLLSRHFEYEADRVAASVVGPETMSQSLRVLAGKSQWSEESDSHPSIEKRLARLS